MPSNNAYGYSSEEVYEPLDNELLDSSGGMGAALGDTLRGAWDDPLGSALSYGKGAVINAADIVAMMEPLANEAFPIRFHETKKGIAERVDALAEDFGKTSSNRGAFESGRFLGGPGGALSKGLGGLGGLATIFGIGHTGSHFFKPTSGGAIKLANMQKLGKKVTREEGESLVRSWDAQNYGANFDEVETVINPSKREFLEFAAEQEEFEKGATKLYRVLEDENGNLVFFDAKIVHDQARGPLDIHNSNPFAHRVLNKKKILELLDDPEKFKASMNLRPKPPTGGGGGINPNIPTWNR